MYGLFRCERLFDQTGPGPLPGMVPVKKKNRLRNTVQVHGRACGEWGNGGWGHGFRTRWNQKTKTRTRAGRDLPACLRAFVRICTHSHLSPCLLWRMCAWVGTCRSYRSKMADGWFLNVVFDQMEGSPRNPENSRFGRKAAKTWTVWSGLSSRYTVFGRKPMGFSDGKRWGPLWQAGRCSQRRTTGGRDCYIAIERSSIQVIPPGWKRAEDAQKMCALDWELRGCFCATFGSHHRLLSLWCFMCRLYHGCKLHTGKIDQISMSFPRIVKLWRSRKQSWRYRSHTVPLSGKGESSKEWNSTTSR